MYTDNEVIILLIKLNNQINKTSGGLGLGESSLFRWMTEHKVNTSGWKTLEDAEYQLNINSSTKD